MSAGSTASEAQHQQGGAREASAPSRELWALGGALACGVLLRVLGLADQVLGDDEFHAIRAALEDPPSRILVTYRLQDHSIPLTLLYRLLLDAGVRLSELGMRAPVLLASFATLLVLPLWVRRRLGAHQAVVFAALLAISPMLVFYSRIVRSYAPVVLFGAVAAGAFYEWWLRGSDEAGRTRRTGAGAVYVVSAALAVWFHLGAAPFVAAPFAFAAIHCAMPGDERARRLRGVWPLAGLALALGAALALFLWPARESLVALMQAKRVEAGLAPGVLVEWFELQSGSRFVVGVVAFWALVLGGAVSLWRRGQGRLLAYGAVLVGGHACGLWLLSPEFRSVILLNRWMLVVLPVLLLFAAEGIVALGPWLVRGMGRPGLYLWRALVPALLLAFFASGPFARADFWSSSFQHHYDWIRISREPASLEADPPTRLLEALATLPPGPIVEYPWHPFWGFNRSFYAYQRAHGRRVLVSNDDALVRNGALAWRNLVAPDAAALAASAARLLVVHANLPREEERTLELGSERGRIATTDAPYALLRRLAERRLPVLQRQLGEPVFRDEGLWIWDLERLPRSAEAP